MVVRGSFNGQGYVDIKRPVLWLHASGKKSFSSLEYLSCRLFQSDPDIEVIITSNQSYALENSLIKNFNSVELPLDTYFSTRNFLNQYKPNFLIWTGDSAVRPVLMKTSAEYGVRMVLVNAAITDFRIPRFWFLYGSTTHRVLKLFSKCYAIDEQARLQLSRLGVTADKIEIKGYLQQATLVPSESRLNCDKLVKAFCGRPVWFAAGIKKVEISSILAAHRLVVRQSHRNLLVLHSNSVDVESIIEKIASENGLNVVNQNEGVIPDNNTHVFVCDRRNSLHNWYSMIPVVFLGQSLSDVSAGGLDPYMPAALGCALLCGSSVSLFTDRYARLSKGNAVKIVNDSSTLADAVMHLINSDKAANMAYTAWKIISEGAEVTDALINQVLEYFDGLRI